MHCSHRSGKREEFECQLATDEDDDNNTSKQILWLKGKALITAGAVADGH